MYKVSTLSQSSQSFLVELSNNAKSRSLVTSIALAKILANNLPLPSAPVDNIEMYFNMQSRISLEEQLSSLNEIIVIDMPMVRDLTVKFFSYRYQVVHPCSHILAIRKETAVEDFFRISKTIDAATLDTIRDNCTMITDLTSKFLRLFEEMLSTNKVG